MKTKKLRSVIFASIITIFAFTNTTKAATYVYCGVGSITSLSSWHNTTCVGATPGNFTTAGDIWNFSTAGSYSLTGTWTLGSNAKVNLGPGGQIVSLSTNGFVMKTGGATNVTLKVFGSSTLIVATGTQFISGNKVTLNASTVGATVVYAVSGATIANVTYDNLTFSANNTLNIATINGIFTNSASATINSSLLTVASVVNSGTIIMGSGGTNLVVNTDLDNTGGTITLGNSSNLTLNGTISNFGTLGGDGTGYLVNAGGTTATLNMDQTTVGTSNAMFEVQNTGVGGITLGSALCIAAGGDITPFSGTIDAGNNLLTLLAAQGQTGAIGDCSGGTFIATSINSDVFHNPNGNATNWTTMGVAGVTNASFQQWRSGFPITCASCLDGCCPAGTAFTSITTYDETLTGGGDFSNAAHYVDLASDASTINNGQGYWVYMGNSSPGTSTAAESINVSGMPQQGLVTLNFTFTDALNGSNMLANPFPSPISWSVVMANNPAASLDGVAYIYDAADGSYGQIAANGTASGNYGLADDVIPAGMAFFIQATATGSIALDETVKSVGGTQDLQRMSSDHNNTQSIAQIPKFSLQAQGVDGKSVTTIQFDSRAAIGIDNIADAPTLIGSELIRVTSQISGKDFGINGLPDVTQNYSIPVKMMVTTSGSYQISALNLQKMPSGACLMLHDNSDNSDYDLRQGPHAITLNSTDVGARFLLNITTTTLSISTNSTQATCPASNDGYITAVGNNAGPWNYTWKNANNVIVKTSVNKTTADTLAGLNNGVYSVDVNTVGSCDNATQIFTMTIAPSQSLAVTANSTLASCPNSNDGYITVVGNNAGPWNYTWKDDANNIILTTLNKAGADTLASLNSGVYSVDVNTVGGCDNATQSFTMTIAAAPSLAITTNSTQASCSNSNDGYITVVGNNAGPWNYAWKNASNVIVKTSTNKASADTLAGLNNGVYSVEVNTDGSCDIGTQTFTITAPVSPASAFSTPSSSVNVNTVVNFTNNSTNAGNFWWTFGNGGTSNLQNPNYTYNTTGTYTVSLYAYNFSCNDTVSSQQVITVQSTTGIASVANGDMFFSKDQNGTYIKFNYSAQNKVNITVYNALGQTILVNLNQVVSNDKIYLNLDNAKDQLIFVSVANLDKNTQLTKKLYNN